MGSSVTSVASGAAPQVGKSITRPGANPMCRMRATSGVEVAVTTRTLPSESVRCAASYASTTPPRSGRPAESRMATAAAHAGAGCAFTSTGAASDVTEAASIATVVPDRSGRRGSGMIALIRRRCVGGARHMDHVRWQGCASSNLADRGASCLRASASAEGQLALPMAVRHTGPPWTRLR